LSTTVAAVPIPPQQENAKGENVLLSTSQTHSSHLSSHLNVACIFKKKLYVSTGAVSDEIRKLLDEKLSNKRYEQGSVQVVVKGKANSNDLYLMNENGTIKYIPSIVVDHM